MAVKVLCWIWLNKNDGAGVMAMLVSDRHTEVVQV